MNSLFTVLFDWPRHIAGYFAWLPPLVIRIVVGWTFMWSGWEKFQILPRMIENFRSWGIPAPQILTPFVSGVEMIGGGLLLVGFLTRIAAPPLMVVMVVAVISAKLANVNSLETLLGFEEVSYFAMFLYLAIAGPGPISVDHLVLSGRRKDRLVAPYGG